MTDYQGNSKKDKVAPKAEEKKKKVEKVITTEAIVQKKPLGRKFKDLIVEADFHSVIRYVAYDVLIPAVRNTIVDASTKGIERMMYGESTVRRRTYGPMAGPRVTYNNPIQRSQSPINVNSRYAPPPPQRGPIRRSRDDVILSSREEAELVLERLNDIIDQYEVVSVGDLNSLIGQPSSHVDEKWGWVYLADVQARQVREGYLLDLPQPEPLQ